MSPIFSVTSEDLKTWYLYGHKKYISCTEICHLNTTHIQNKFGNWLQYDENSVKCLKIQILLYIPNKLARFECIKTICARIKASRDAHAKPKKVCWSENDIKGPCICFENRRKCLCIAKTALLEVKDVLEFTMHTCMHDLHQNTAKTL